jgi:hypothetical protein
MDLLDRYLQAVRFWLPKSQKQDDLIAELGEDLRSQIEAKEEELGRPLDKNEVGEILKRCGPPMIVGARLGPKHYLIGPGLFPIYTFVLKMVLFWILVPVFIFIVGPTHLASSKDLGSAIASTIGDLWSGLFIAAGVITLVFAILERTNAQVAAACKWNPDSLPPLRTTERKPSMLKVVCELGFGVFGLVWLLLLPQHPWMILGPAAAFLKAAPMWHTFYIPILLLGVFGLLRGAITLGRPEWTWFPHLAEVVQMALTLVLLNFMLNAAGQPPNGAWHPFLMIADAAKGSAQARHVAAIVNVSILLSLAATWLGISIGMVVHVWQFLVYLRKRDSNARQAASLQAR